VVKVALVLAAIAAGAAAFRALRPKKTSGTGSSLPPKIRPVPQPVTTEAEAVAATVADSTVDEPLVTSPEETAPSATAPVGADTTVAPEADELTGDDLPEGPSDAALGGTPTES
jgi:hypothetical protein